MTAMSEGKKGKGLGPHSRNFLGKSYEDFSSQDNL